MGYDNNNDNNNTDDSDNDDTHKGWIIVYDGKYSVADQKKKTSHFPTTSKIYIEMDVKGKTWRGQKFLKWFRNKKHGEKQIAVYLYLP